MDLSTILSVEQEKAFSHFCARYHLNAAQAQQFLAYMHLLSHYNKNMNITAVESGTQTIERHFEDSLALVLPPQKPLCLADIGTGGGFPGIPLKIAYPSLTLILVEVNQKKVGFLNEVIEKLGLADVIVSSLDWRTFLRKTTYPIDFFVSRASLPPNELLRIFKPSSLHQHATLVYWASAYWKATRLEKNYISQEYHYTLENKDRRLIFFNLSTQPKDVTKSINK